MKIRFYRCFHRLNSSKIDDAPGPEVRSAADHCLRPMQAGYRLKRLLLMVILVFIIPSFVHADAESQENSKKLTIGVRADAPPFSSFDSKDPAKASGYTVDLCRRIAERAIREGLYNEYEFKLVTAATRFDLLQCGAIDLLCGATTVTLERSRVADFSLFTFLSGISVMYLEEEPETNEGGTDPLYVGVLGETTSETEARRILENLERTHDNFGLPPSRPIKLKTVRSHYEGFLQLTDGQIKAYLADREILLALQAKKIADIKQAQKNMADAIPEETNVANEAPDNAKLDNKKTADVKTGENKIADAKPPKTVVSDDYYSFEPYAIGIHIGNAELRYIANSVLSQLYNWDLLGNQHEHIFTVLSRNFPRKRFSKTLESLFRLQRLNQGQPIPVPDKTDPCPGAAAPSNSALRAAASSQRLAATEKGRILRPYP